MIFDAKKKCILRKSRSVKKARNRAKKSHKKVKTRTGNILDIIKDNRKARLKWKKILQAEAY